MKKRREPVSEGAESAWTLSKGLQDLLTCPACGGFFSDPVTEHSGDTFCRDCLPQKSQPAYLHTNWKMQNLVRLAKQLKPFLEEPQATLEGWCAKHQENWSFFCREDNEKICLVCHYSILHEGHTLTQLQDLDTKQEEGALDTDQSRSCREPNLAHSQMPLLLFPADLVELCNPSQSKPSLQ
uniref:E3 ubiquitin-protein ligase TRIM4-like isoform X1 n=1 Tax=Phascolarctos cinereus TaxID=38626 RepID=A0A6P5LML0_PHACI|nr:E3 ubiquitin-protein ligase TRIM4-like isoform X1 [Phascolarctos cinereus]XP_020859650.1 E3 ubiquitin-protein ligase TRIM4-like isoform X1 [Phascolarctos cinereus]XP_020859651.1 E3 ubiquitin-protein ligase TRIM4-like isoform X1 [Phascolarctos cinereus]XP_020859652.1 E3 ubiquitin-protein ligase TRIM4-like isoform X1 [Phascolarctos cinereus]XP_020859653.1 E3 ubiquitin-protein ligase TRIM4-like isoform X1 [Phascolarctos cinereus]XP_020859654.1 E3 ubiquitin-protein ligase TRIM4-like isoform X1 